MATEQDVTEVIDEAPEVDSAIEEAAPADLSDAGSKSKSPVPYDRFKQVNKERKWLRKQLAEQLAKQGQPSQATFTAPAKLPEPEPEYQDPKLAAAARMIRQEAARAVNLDPVNQKIGSLEAKLATIADQGERETFWKEHAEDTDLKDEVEARFGNMIALARQSGQNPLFTRDDIYNYTLGAKTRASRAKDADRAAQVARANKAALNVAGSRPGVAKPPPKSPGDRSIAEMEADPGFRDFQF